MNENKKQKNIIMIQIMIMNNIALLLHNDCNRFAKLASQEPRDEASSGLEDTIACHTNVLDMIY